MSDSANKKFDGNQIKGENLNLNKVNEKGNKSGKKRINNFFLDKITKAGKFYENVDFKKLNISVKPTEPIILPNEKIDNSLSKSNDKDKQMINVQFAQISKTNKKRLKDSLLKNISIGSGIFNKQIANNQLPQFQISKTNKKRLRDDLFKSVSVGVGIFSQMNTEKSNTNIIIRNKNKNRIRKDLVDSVNKSSRSYAKILATNYTTLKRLNPELLKEINLASRSFSQKLSNKNSNSKRLNPLVIKEIKNSSNSFSVGSILLKNRKRRIHPTLLNEIKIAPEIYKQGTLSLKKKLKTGLIKEINNSAVAFTNLKKEISLHKLRLNGILNQNTEIDYIKLMQLIQNYFDDNTVIALYSTDKNWDTYNESKIAFENYKDTLLELKEIVDKDGINSKLKERHHTIHIDKVLSPFLKLVMMNERVLQNNLDQIILSKNPKENPKEISKKEQKFDSNKNDNLSFEELYKKQVKMNHEIFTSFKNQMIKEKKYYEVQIANEKTRLEKEINDEKKKSIYLSNLIESNNKKPNNFNFQTQVFYFLLFVLGILVGKILM